MVGGQIWLLFGGTVLLKLEAALAEAGFEVRWVGWGALWDRVSSRSGHA